MSSIFTRSELVQALKNWKAAYLAVSSGKSYSIGGRSLTRQDVATIRDQISWLTAQLEALDQPVSGTLKNIHCRTVR